MSTPPLQDPTLRLLEEAENYTFWLLARARPYLRGRVLDFGAGIGTFSAELASVADELVVLEPDPAFAARLRERLGATSGVTIVERDELEPGSVDAIVCFNVLEHIADHAATLARFHELLRPGGHLLLLVPGHPSLFGGIDRAVAHERRYRKDDVRELLAAAGLTPVDVRRVNPVGALGWLVWSRLLGREQLPQRSTRVYDRLVPVFRALDRVEFPLGLSVWAVGRRG
jgi:SAM-dependent methyltransferase